MSLVEFGFVLSVIALVPCGYREELRQKRCKWVTGEAAVLE